MQYRMIALAGLLAITSVVGQTKAPGKPWSVPRTSDGKPDLQGIWSGATLTPLERPKGLGTKEFYSDAEFAELSARVRKGEAHRRTAHGGDRVTGRFERNGVEEDEIMF